MKPFTRKSVSILSSQSPVFNGTTVSKFCCFSTVQNPQHSLSYQSRRHEEESRNVRVSVWWDIENCSLPADANVFRASQSITTAIRANGIRGPIQITAFGDVLQLSRPNQEALSSTGISLNHIPSGGKNSADRSLLVNLMYWVSQNPPPAHLFIISGDKDFASILHRLRMSNYNILLASSDPAPSVLCSAASIMWHWSSLIKGENLNGKHFNQPPDGPYGSWYGQYKFRLEDPFVITAESSDSGSDCKIHSIPRLVVRQICSILNSYPEGLSLTDLSEELGKSNLNVDKEYYGYKKFSKFLQSMPNVFKVQTGKEGQQIVIRVLPKFPSKVSKTSDFVSDSSDDDLNVVTKISESTPSFSDSSKPESKASLTKMDEPEKESKESFTKIEEPKQESKESFAKVGAVKKESKEYIAKMVDVEKKEMRPTPYVETISKNNYNSNDDESILNGLQPMEEQDSASEPGFFRRIWKSLFGDGEQKLVSTEESVEHEESMNESGDSILESSNHPKNDDLSKDCTRKDSTEDSGIFTSFMTWCGFGRSHKPSENPKENLSDTDNVKIDDEKNGIFSKESFWAEMTKFIHTVEGSEAVLQSRDRKHLAKNLQNQGPKVLKTLTKTDILHLVDLLISDRKLIEESPIQNFPFKLIKPNSQNSSSSSLRSIFSSAYPRAHEGDITNQNVPHSQPKKPISKTKKEILNDTQNLLNEICIECPEGFNMGMFRKMFHEKYGYTLDLQKIGHQKLATLLQTMTGVKVVSNYVIPLSTLPQENSDDSQQNHDSDCSDSQWEELGPVSKAGLNPTPTGQAEKMKEPVYEPLIDSVFSDSEDEVELKRRTAMNKDNSSLLQILDSWYVNQDDEIDRHVVGENNDFDPTPEQPRQQPKNPTISYGRKQRPSRNYSFVVEQKTNVVDNKDKIIDGILGSLKKSNDRSRESTVG